MAVSLFVVTCASRPLSPATVRASSVSMPLASAPGRQSDTAYTHGTRYHDKLSPFAEAHEPVGAQSLPPQKQNRDTTSSTPVYLGHPAPRAPPLTTPPTHSPTQSGPHQPVAAGRPRAPLHPRRLSAHPSRHHRVQTSSRWRVRRDGGAGSP